jgi:hypothetical protein
MEIVIHKKIVHVKIVLMTLNATEEGHGVETVHAIQMKIVHVQIVIMTQNVVLVDGVAMVLATHMKHVVVVIVELQRHVYVIMI